MTRYKNRNNAIKTHVVAPDNCMCTVREFISDTSATAYAVEDDVVDYNDIRADITWMHTPTRSIIHWDIRKLGVEFSKSFLADATDERIDAVITSGFEQMDEAHKTNEE